MGLTRYRMNPAGLATNIFAGDPVKIASNGYIVLASGATDYVVGVFMGCVYNDLVTKRMTHSLYYPASTSVGTDPAGIQALVADNPHQHFVIQADASVSVGDAGWNFEVSLGAGSTTTGRSTTALKASTRTAGTKLVRIVDLYEQPDNAYADAFPLVEVQFVQHQFARASAA